MSPSPCRGAAVGSDIGLVVVEGAACGGHPARVPPSVGFRGRRVLFVLYLDESLRFRERLQISGTSPDLALFLSGGFSFVFVLAKVTIISVGIPIYALAALSGRFF